MCYIAFKKVQNDIFSVFKNTSDKMNSFKRYHLSDSIMNFHFSLKAEENSSTGKQAEIQDFRI